MHGHQSSPLFMVDFDYPCESPKSFASEDNLNNNRLMELLKPRQHALEGLCNGVIRKAKVPLFTKLSTDELSILLNLPSEINNTEEDLLSLILTALPIFDKAFFFNSVGSHISDIEITGALSNKQGSDIGFESCQGNFEGKKRKLSISRKSKQDINLLGTQVQRYLMVLIHEMLHIFLETYSGRSRFGENQHGCTGHGTSWCDSMFAIAQSLESDVGWETDWGLEQGVQNEINQGMKIPTKEQLERWELMLINGTTEVLSVSHLDSVAEDYVLFEHDLQDDDPTENTWLNGGSDENTLDGLMKRLPPGDNSPKK
jgi:hypothetical protein